MTSPIEYVRHGWAVVPFDRGLKGPDSQPKYKRWNTLERCVTDVAAAACIDLSTRNVGLAHAYSLTAAIDIDDLDMAAGYLQEHGIDLNDLLSAPDAVMISSGRPNRAKLLYRVPEPIPSKKVIEKIDGKQHSIVDFRCATRNGRTCQDVLPPSLHPDTGQPYVWKYNDELVGDWRSLPDIPANLLSVWRGLVSHEPDADGIREIEEYTLDELRTLLYQHDPDCDRDTWVARMAPISLHTGGSAEGLELCVEWSSQGSKFAGRADVERVWRSYSHTGNRLLTAASLRVDEAATADDFDVIPENPSNTITLKPSTQLPALHFSTDEDGHIFSSKENLLKALSRSDWCGTRIVLDTFRDDIMLAPHATDELRALKDTDYERFGIWLEFNNFKTISHENIRRSVALVADDQQIDSAQLWLESLQWDGVPRIERFLTDYFAAGDSPYIRAVSLYWWTAHAGRVLEPGCKADMVPILVGKQGVGKSTGVAAIAPAPENFVEVRLDQEDEEIARRIRGCLIAEIGELRGLQSREAESIKGMITTTHDKWTPKYVERSHTVARRLVFVGTTNNEEFLADETGNRRWLPVRVGKVRVAAIRDDRLQMWAEARDLWRASGIAYSDAETLACGVHDAHMVHDVWEESVTRWLDGSHPDDLGGMSPARRGSSFSMSDVLSGALGLELKNVGVAQERRVGKILRLLGFEKKDVKVDGRSKKLWVAHGRPSEPTMGDHK